MSARKVILAALVIYAVYLSTAWWVHRDYAPIPEPDGLLVEPLLKIEKGPGFSYVAQTFILWKYADESEQDMRSPVVFMKT